MGGQLDRDHFPDNILDRLTALEQEMKAVQTALPGASGEVADRVAYYRPADAGLYMPGLMYGKRDDVDTRLYALVQNQISINGSNYTITTSWGDVMVGQTIVVPSGGVLIATGTSDVGVSAFTSATTVGSRVELDTAPDSGQQTSETFWVPRVAGDRNGLHSRLLARFDDETTVVVSLQAIKIAAVSTYVAYSSHSRLITEVYV